MPGSNRRPRSSVWAAGEQTAVTRVLSILDDVRGHGVYDLATLSVAIREIRSLV